MDKYDIVLDLVEHPDKYLPERIAEILSDPEARKIYNLLCKAYSTLTSTEAEVDVDAEWQRFSQLHKKSNYHSLWNTSRAASIVSIAFTSLAAVAIGITVAVNTFEPKPQPIEVVAESSVESPVTLSEPIDNDSTVVPLAVSALNPSIVFEDAPLEEILNRVAEVHGTTVEYKSPETAQLHLYYRFDPNIPLKEILEQLNTFEQINIRISGKKIIVD